MRCFLTAVLLVGVLLALLARAAHAQSEQPAGGPQLFYVVHILPLPQPEAHGAVSAVVFPIEVPPEDCQPASFATQAEAAADAAQRFPAGEWYVVQAADAAHAWVAALDQALMAQVHSTIPATAGEDRDLAELFARQCAAGAAAALPASGSGGLLGETTHRTALLLAGLGVLLLSGTALLARGSR